LESHLGISFTLIRTYTWTDKSMIYASISVAVSMWVE